MRKGAGKKTATRLFEKRWLNEEVNQRIIRRGSSTERIIEVPGGEMPLLSLRTAIFEMRVDEKDAAMRQTSTTPAGTDQPLPSLFHDSSARLVRALVHGQTPQKKNSFEIL
ncbi:hypothetical protein NPIL_35251 [Nephila pilipes]|uniref:Uncharacterized protein n=1 Tax=Nephila pilipes TaxID=299642 RepID=A0A8X6NB19_NEPPI|nr:hypothetical protein NPIL_35251 [Nephila pilipes]